MLLSNIYEVTGDRHSPHILGRWDSKRYLLVNIGYPSGGGNFGT